MDEVNKLSKRVLRYTQTLEHLLEVLRLKNFETKFLKKEHQKNAQDLREILVDLKDR